MNGKGFVPQCTEGYHVQRGQILLQIDPAAIQKAGRPTVTAILVTNSDDYAEVKPLKMGEIAVTDPLIAIR